MLGYIYGSLSCVEAEVKETWKGCWMLMWCLIGIWVKVKQGDSDITVLIVEEV
jgi:hypothetical protein